MRLIIGNTDVSQFYNRLNITGDDQSIARQLEFGIVVSGTDKNLPKLNIAMNDNVKLFDDEGKIIFDGTVAYKEKSIKGNIMEVRCLQSIIALKSIGSYSFENKNPSAIASQLISECGLKSGTLVSATSLTRKFDMQRKYDIIHTAYFLDYEQTKKPYIIRQQGDKVEVVEKGKEVSKFILNAKSNILDSRYSENIEESVSKVEIFDENGKKQGEVSGNGLKGTSLIYRQEKNENAQARAKEMLKQIERMATVSAFGDFSLITGNAVMIKEPFTGLWGKFFITADSHTIENRTHKVDLTLSFKNTMTEPNTEGKDEESSNGLSVDGISGNTIGAKALSAGAKVQGAKYRWGGNNPSTGVDCSGFVTWAYKQAGANIPGRLTSAGLRSNPKAYGFQEIPFSERQPGDVLWQQGHVAMQYTGGQIIESGGVSKRKLGYSGVAITSGKGRTFSKAYRYVGRGGN